MFNCLVSSKLFWNCVVVRATGSYFGVFCGNARYCVLLDGIEWYRAGVYGIVWHCVN